ncbi:MAG: Nre family DNA repair protein [Candidatus Helarchaeota archaeon]
MVRPNLPKGLCVICKTSRKLCGKDVCPIIIKQQALIPMKKINFSEELFGSSPPSFFVGRNNYPNVLVGPMIPPVTGKGKDIQILDRPDWWYGKGIEELVEFRTKLVRSAFRVDVRKVQENRILTMSQELAMAEIPVDTEAKFEKEPKFRILFDSHTQPMGPIAHIRKLQIVDNPKVNLFVEKVFQDTDLKANSAISYLYYQKLPITDIIRVLSAGLLGTKKKRRLVPTRWAITAADDSVSKELISSKIKTYSEIDKYHVFSAKYLDNNFQILLIPREWGFEQLETWSGKSAFNPDQEAVIVHDHEFYPGRKTYASRVTGAYYAARLAVAEYLVKIKRQATIVIFREVKGGYIVPLGVWVIRETVRDAFNRKPKIFETLKESLIEIGKQFQTPLRKWIKNSKIIENVCKQRRLLDYIKFKPKPPQI